MTRLRARNGSTYKLPKSENTIRVEKEIASIESVFKRYSVSRERAREFLLKAGIVDKRGNLSKNYR